MKDLTGLTLETWAPASVCLIGGLLVNEGRNENARVATSQALR